MSTTNLIKDALQLQYDGIQFKDWRTAKEASEVLTQEFRKMELEARQKLQELHDRWSSVPEMPHLTPITTQLAPAPQDWRNQ